MPVATIYEQDDGSMIIESIISGKPEGPFVFGADEQCDSIIWNGVESDPSEIKSSPLNCQDVVQAIASIRLGVK